MRLTAIAALLLVTLLAACRRPLPDLPPSQVPVPAARDVESVIFLFGDAGYADERRDPVLRVLRGDIEDWSARVARDSAVVVLFLGDIVYPRGLTPPGESSHERDSLSAQSQVNLLAGPSARRHRTFGYFLAGNHDWGSAHDFEGARRLKNLEEFLDRRRAGGVHVLLQPKAGEPGPAVVDVGRQTRLLLYDTAWWLLAQETIPKLNAYRRTEEILRTTTGRNIIVAAHHPFETASSHGGAVPIWKAFGLRFLLSRSGSVLQDLNSIKYRELKASLLNSFRAGPPLLYAGGHDHALQVFENPEFPHPRYSVVSGTGSKVSRVGYAKGLLYRAEAPGYMRVITHRNGQVDLFVIAAPDKDHLHCEVPEADLERCMSERAREFTITFGRRLK